MWVVTAFDSSHAYLLCRGYFSQHHVDTLDPAMSPVQFLASRFPGKTEQEYRGHLGNFQISGMTGCANFLWSTCSLFQGWQAPAYWHTFWRSEVSCRVCCLIIAKSSYIVIGWGEYRRLRFIVAADTYQPTNHLDIEVQRIYIFLHFYWQFNEGSGCADGGVEHLEWRSDCYLSRRAIHHHSCKGGKHMQVVVSWLLSKSV